MSSDLRASLERLGRLVQIRETYVSVAEARVKEAENQVRQLEAADREAVGNIQQEQAAIAYFRTATGDDVQARQRHILALEYQRKLIRQSLETATTNLEERRREWTEAMREQKVATKLQERRLHQWEREADLALQKLQDDAATMRYVRTRLEDL